MLDSIFEIVFITRPSLFVVTEARSPRSTDLPFLEVAATLSWGS